MKDLIMLYVLHYGALRTLEEITVGFGNASVDQNSDYRDMLINISSSINNIRKDAKASGVK